MTRRPLGMTRHSAMAAAHGRNCKNDASGNITFDLGEQFVDKTVETNKITYYLVEQAGGDSGIEYDHTVCRGRSAAHGQQNFAHEGAEKDDQTKAWAYVHNCTIASVSVTRHSRIQAACWVGYSRGGDGYYSIGCSDGSKTFTNKYTPPVHLQRLLDTCVTKVVEVAR